MKRNWTTNKLVEQWTLLPNELEPVGSKVGPTRLGFAVLFKFFQGVLVERPDESTSGDTHAA